MTIVATFDVSDVFVEDWAQINCWSEHNIPVNYSSFKPKILCFFLFDIKEQISIVSFVIIYLYESNEQKNTWIKGILPQTETLSNIYTFT